jgi:alpha-L-arabinofuranosidase
MKKNLFILILLAVATFSFGQTTVNMTVDANASKYTISRHIYGHFSEHLGRCIYDGYWVSPSLNVPKQDRIRLDVVEALKKVKIPNLRWPGGCFADEYHWMDGIGPRENRPTMVNTHWGGVTEDNSFGTHEFLLLCELLETEPFIVGNVGSGTPEEMSKWVEYLNFSGISPMSELRRKNGRENPWNVEWFGIGNESWGCGGNMTPEFYTDLYRQFATFTKNYPGVRLNKIATGPNGADYNWTEVFMKNVRLNMVWGLDFHYYTRPPRGRFAPGQGQAGQQQVDPNAPRPGSATNFDESTYFATLRNALRMDELIKGHSAIMDKYDSLKRVALVVGEWGIWTDVEPGTNPGFLYQQNSLRDALIAGSTLNIFNNHADRVKMAQLAQTVNVLQALILTEGEKMILTPTYHVFDMYKVHMDAKLLPITLTSPNYTFDGQSIPAINASASRDEKGVVHITIVNLDPTKSITINTTLPGVTWSSVSGQVLTSPKFTDHNTFTNPNVVKLASFNGARKQGNNLNVVMPAKSVVTLVLK